MIMILKEIFKHAVQCAYLDANPVRYVEFLLGEDKEMGVLTPEEMPQRSSSNSSARRWWSGGVY